jgi:AcrR family transcriptional regulator
MAKYEPLSSASQDDTATQKRTSSKGGGTSSAPATSRGEITKQHILDAAEEVFGELGYYEASVSEITRRAGVAQGTFYIYFRSKREIFVELVQDLGERLRAATRTAMADAPDRLEAERRGFAAFFEFAANHHRVYSIVQEAERVAPEAAQAYYQGISRGYIRGLSAAMEAGEIRSMSPDAVAYALMGIGHFIALRWIIWPQQDAETQGEAAQLPDDILASVMDFIMHGLSVPPKEESRS